MATNSVSAPNTPQKPGVKRRPTLLVSGLAIRVLFAIVISWLILLAFFVTTVGSH